MKGKVLAVALIVTLQLSTNLSLEAQNNSCIPATVICFNNSQWYAVCVPPLPPGVFNCTGFDFTEYCQVWTYECPPAPCPDCDKARAGGPISLATGNTYLDQSDVVLPGLGGGLRLTRTWNSTPGVASYGMFGHQWVSNFEEQVFVGSDNMIKHLRGDGSLWTYGYGGEGPNGNTPTYLTAAPRNGAATLAYNGYLQGYPSWTLTLKNGETRNFTAANTGNLTYPPSSHLSSIADRNGNSTALTYDANSHLLTSAADAASRHLYFGYQTILVGGISVSVVTNVTSDFGVSLSYQYDSLANLTKVTRPDNTFVTFEYSPAGMLTAVKDSNGKILESHTYDTSGRGLTSSRAGGVDSITVSY